MTINRRHFLKVGAGLCLAAPNLSLAADAGTPNATPAQLNITRLRLPIGAQKPFQALHISDTHLCFADERDNERKRALAVARRRYFSKAEPYFDAALAHAKRNGETLLHTGDLIDFVSESNLDAVQARLDREFCFVSSGNHEFSQYVGEAWEDDAYKAQSYERVQKSFPNDLTFCSRIINGVNFVALDDVYYNFSDRLLPLFKAETAKGLPIVMLCHCPLYTPELYDAVFQRSKTDCAYVVGAPEERMQTYSAHRRRQQTADEPTKAMISWLKDQPLLKAILCGHLHFNWSGPFSEFATQYVVGGTYQGFAYEIEFCQANS